MQRDAASHVSFHTCNYRKTFYNHNILLYITTHIPSSNKKKKTPPSLFFLPSIKLFHPIPPHRPASPINSLPSLKSLLSLHHPTTRKKKKKARNFFKKKPIYTLPPDRPPNRQPNPTFTLLHSVSTSYTIRYDYDYDQTPTHLPRTTIREPSAVHILTNLP
ncbi:hypothetical protein DM02DRAFT_3140 [Periconia macrospinosa]|uniref:Uncharacterized protein n=1 Tax=Periconia macrospinosa TaxID=97972 RepID=A0A2V1ED40_9PLEO|nr:hypothetical protein DM02DRAFT_3140 [Periconia macrospinosa]